MFLQLIVKQKSKKLLNQKSLSGSQRNTYHSSYTACNCSVLKTVSLYKKTAHNKVANSKLLGEAANSVAHIHLMYGKYLLINKSLASKYQASLWGAGTWE